MVRALIAVVLGVGCLAWMGTCGADEPAAAGSKAGEPAAQAAAPQAPAEKEEAWQNRWFFTWGATNLHPGLAESEGRINRLINGTLGRVLPRWERPATFKDWSDDFRIWDLHFGFGRDINQKWAWAVNSAVTSGLVKNNETYRVPMFLKTDIDFKREVLGVIGSVGYYPFGKPALAPNQSRFLQSLLGTRPALKLAGCYAFVHTAADIKLSVPGVFHPFKKLDQHDYNLFYISPRIGVEVPVTANNVVGAEVGPQFFTSHSDEFNALAVYVFHKHYF